MGKGMKKSRKWFLLLGTIFRSLRHLERCGIGIVSSAERGVAIQYSRHAQLGVEVQRKKGINMYQSGIQITSLYCSGAYVERKLLCEREVAQL